MTDNWLDASLFANFALLFYVMGLLARNPLRLRLLLLTGTFFYILYYSYIAEEPLWDAIYASLVIGAANISAIAMLLLDRSTFGMNPETRELFDHFPTMNPGQFRRIMKCASWHTAQGEERICTEGEPPPALYFVLDGGMSLERDGRRSEMSAGVFIGEMSFIRGPQHPASATVWLSEGARYVAWDRGKLYRQAARSAAIANALGALFNRDLIRKLATSWPEAPGRGRPGPA